MRAKAGIGAVIVAGGLLAACGSNSSASGGGYSASQVEQSAQSAANTKLATTGTGVTVTATRCIHNQGTRWTCNFKGSDGEQLTFGATVGNGSVILDSTPQGGGG